MNRLDKLKSLQDPSYAASLGMDRMESIAHAFGAIKGEDGYTPQKGRDYFTPQEISSWKQFILDTVRKATPVKGLDYHDGVSPIKGINYHDGTDGKTPVAGVDFWTPEDKKRITQEAAKLIVVKDGVSPKIEDIVPAVIEAMKDQLEYKHIKGAPDLKDLPSLIEFLKRGGFRGGGGSSSPSGATAKSADLSSQCTGSNLVFTIPVFTSILSLVGSDAPIVYRPTIDFTAAGTTLTLLVQNAPSSGSTLILTYV